MVSEQAKDGLNRIFARAAQASLALDDSDTVTVEPLATPQIVETPQILVLTVASYVFRLLTVFHLNEDRATQDYFTRASPGRPFGEVVGELGNLCCGAMNRELGQHFVHTGMSTPTLLKGACLPFIGALKPAFVSPQRIVINGALTLHATLCLCAYAPIDFHVAPHVGVPATGELELF